ncbi:MAG: uroporphyrinogen-III C-methyltransferase [Candidatus Methanomethylophilaceae archaeon]|nr:uroporphyrinogen-III C-methyltransferase [Candidatus Methanomethylophilaceae archaeon]
MTGKVYLVGAGPGDPGLLTVKAADLIRKADVVVYDALANHEILDSCKEGVVLIDAGKRGGNHTMTQDQTNAKLVELAEAGKVVVRLKGGDPFMFGRGAEEAEELRKAGLEVHVVPGISSTISVPELCGIPVTHRDHTPLVTFLTGHEKADRDEDRINWKALVGGHGTLVILMGMGNAEHISSELLAGGMDPQTPAAIITNGSTPQQRIERTVVSRLKETIDSKGLSAPGIMVIGSVATLHDVLGDLR